MWYWFSSLINEANLPELNDFSKQKYVLQSLFKYEYILYLFHKRNQ